MKSVNKQPGEMSALVTGANRGIGHEVCRQLAGRGWHVFACVRDMHRNMAAMAQIAGNVTVLELDVADADAIEQLPSRLRETTGRLDVLVNNAGILGSPDGLGTTPSQELREVMETNFFGAAHLTRVLLPLLANSPSPRIINVSSGMGALDDLDGSYASYRLSKAGLNALTILSAREHPQIRINAVCPGWVRTAMGGSNAPRPVAAGADTIVWLATAAEVPTGKFIRDRKVINW